MKPMQIKQLLGPVVGLSLALSGAALAQQEGPELYGKINLSLENEGYDPGTDRWELSSNASRLGVEGGFDTEISGIRAIYQAEFELQVDDGDNNDGDADGDAQILGQRDIFGGIEGPWGRLRAGNFDTPTKEAQGDLDRFDNLDGDIKYLMAGENRVANIVQYDTPEFAGLITLQAALIPAEDARDLDGDGVAEHELDDGTSMALLVEESGFFGAVARDDRISEALQTSAEASGVAGDSLDITRVSLGYEGERFSLGAIGQEATEVAGDGEERSWMASGTVELPARLALRAQHGVTTGERSDEELTLSAVGLDLRASKQSKLYAYGSRRTLELADSEETTLGLGLEHKF
jgi:predicted porin